MELGYSTLTRRERLERIAMAERDRRAGRIEVAIAALGEASEWPARAVLALARLQESEGAEARLTLEEGLDIWAAEVGLAPLDEDTESLQAAFEAGFDADVEHDAEPGSDPDSDHEFAHEADGARDRDPHPAEHPYVEHALGGHVGSNLDRPIEVNELERAFAEAEAQTDEMLGANDVAERILLDEPIGLAELDGEVAASDPEFVHTEPDRAQMDAAQLDSTFGVVDESVSQNHAEAEASDRSRVLATLERWLQNLEGRDAGRAL